jgi:hypothetical protein
LHEFDSWRTVAHLRDLLMDAGALPPIDRQITLFDRWAQRRLTATTDADHSWLLRQFVSSHQLPQLHPAARRAPLTASARNKAAAALLEAEQLLGWLDRHALSLSTLSQRDLDSWDIKQGDRAAQVFLCWAQRIGHAPQLQQAPAAPRRRQPPLSQRRQAQLDRTRSSPTTPLSCARAPQAALLLEVAERITRIVKLTVDDVLSPGQDGQGRQDVYLRLGHPPTPLPEPLAALLLELIDARADNEHREQP